MRKRRLVMTLAAINRRRLENGFRQPVGFIRVQPPLTMPFSPAYTSPSWRHDG